MDLSQQIAAIKQEWPHRDEQIDALVSLLAPAAPSDVLVHGPPATGKTGVARAVASLRPHAYLRCTRATRLRPALAAILGQLQGGGGSGGATGKRKRAAGYAAPSGSEASLIADLQAACGAHYRPPAPAAPPPATAAAAAAGGSDAASAGGSGNMRDQQQQHSQQQRHPHQSAVVVLDDAHHLLMADDAAARPGDGAPVLRGLLRLREQAGLSLAFVLISGADAGAGAAACLSQASALHSVAFPQYTPAQARALLVRWAPRGADAALYARFLESLLLPAAGRISRCLPDLRAAAAALWDDYARPIRAGSGKGSRGGGGSGGGGAAADEAMLFAAAKGAAAALSRTFEPGASAACVVGGGAAGADAGAAAAATAAATVGLSALGRPDELELPRVAQFLLVAAYLASRNRPSVDKQLFENSGPRGARRGAGGGRARGGAQALDRRAEAAKAAQLRGPHTFTLQRLLHIYRMLRRADGGEGDRAAAAAGGGGNAAAAAAADAGFGASAAAAAAAAIFGGGGGGRGVGYGSKSGGVGGGSWEWGVDAATSLRGNNNGESAGFFGGSGGYGGGGGNDDAAAAGIEDDDVSPLDIDGAPLLSAIAGLVSRRLLSGGAGGAGAAGSGVGGGSDALAAPRYGCEAPAAAVEALALRLKVNLAAYLRYV